MVTGQRRPGHGAEHYGLPPAGGEELRRSGHGGHGGKVVDVGVGLPGGHFAGRAVGVDAQRGHYGLQQLPQAYGGERVGMDNGYLRFVVHIDVLIL